MSRKLSVAAVALALAGGVYFAGGTAKASNMGFKLERSFSFVPSTPSTRYLETYYVGFPLFNGLADTATETPGGDGCAAGPDTKVTLTDFICDAFTDRTTCGTCRFTVTNVNTSVANCRNETLAANKTIVGLTFNGSGLVNGGQQLTDSPTRERGFIVQVTGKADGSTVNHAVIVGSHDPSWTGMPISVSNACYQTLISVPYHVMYTTACEIMCGLAGPNPPTSGDYLDANGDTVPDATNGAGSPIPAPARCPNGIWDKTTGKRVAVTTYDNEPGNNARFCNQANADGNNQTIAVQAVAGIMSINGCNFQIAPGEAYLINLVSGHTNTVFLPPHF